ncbi:unnamed protein product [Effrenium voratum]|nr:unnamed protein product [Effrenium voratum]
MDHHLLPPGNSKFETRSRGLAASRFDTELALAATDTGLDRYATMTQMRSQVNALYPGAFPYSFDFLYWEEVGIIDVELTRNLLICGGIILVVICALVPQPRVAIWVVLCVCLSIIDTLGFMYFWGVTISGVSTTIYILICVGLAVDYAAHIAHMFKESPRAQRENAPSLQWNVSGPAPSTRCSPRCWQSWWWASPKATSSAFSLRCSFWWWSLPARTGFGSYQSCSPCWAAPRGSQEFPSGGVTWIRNEAYHADSWRRLP